MAFDAFILSLGLGQKCVEGVRRLETPTAPLLLRTSHAPSENWVRRIIKRYVDGSGMASKLHIRMTGAYLDAVRDAEDDRPVVFYVDNHILSPLAGFLRGDLDDKQRILLGFDRDVWGHCSYLK